MRVDGKMLGEEACEETKKVVSKYGVTVVCDEEAEEKAKADIVMPADENCENMKKIGSKVGITVVCDEEA